MKDKDTETEEHIEEQVKIHIQINTNIYILTYRKQYQDHITKRRQLNRERTRSKPHRHI